MSIITKQETSLSKFENFLNISGYVTGVSTVTGSIRAVIGIVQMVAGGLLALAALIFGVATNSDSDKQSAAKFFDYAKHGAANVARGLVEIIPVFGNLATCMYDLSNKNY